MSVLYVPVVPPPPPSRQARELAGILDRVIQDYERTHDSVTPGEIRQALMLAQRGGSGLQARRLFAVGVALFALLAGFVTFALGRSGEPIGSEPWAELAVGVALIVVLVVVVLRRRP